MGGKEGGRGYLYQGIVAVLEALRRNDWDRIYIEFPTEGDKVDIALKSADTITDAIQVKSTVNSFSKGDISKWLKDIRWNILWESVVQMESQVLQRASSEPWSALRNVILKSHSSQTGGFLSMTYLRCSQMRIMTLSIRRFAAVQDLLEQLMIALI